MLETMMMSIAVETSMLAMAEIHELIVSYDKRGIDVVPISELKQAMSKATSKAASKNSMSNRIMESLMKGEFMEKSKFQQVKEFNEEIINLKPVDPAHSLAGKRLDWFLNVVKEEAHEFEEAWKKADTVGMLDALIDMAYFLLGRVYECGFTEAEWDKCFAAVHECNMTKRKGNKGRGSVMMRLKMLTG